MTDTKTIKKSGPAISKVDPYLAELDSSMDELETPESETVIVKAPQPSSAGRAPAAPTLASELLKLSPDIEVSLVAVMGRRKLSIKDLLTARAGQVLELDRGLHEALELVVNGVVVARGELVDIEGRVGVKIVEVLKTGV